MGCWGKQERGTSWCSIAIVSPVLQECPASIPVVYQIGCGLVGFPRRIQTLSDDAIELFISFVEELIFRRSIVRES